MLSLQTRRSGPLAARWLLALAAATATAEGVEPWDGPAFRAGARELLDAASSLPAPAEAEAQVLLYETAFTIEVTGVTTSRERMVYRILKPAGLGTWSAVEARWSPWYQDRPRLEARVIGPDGQARALDPARVTEAATTGAPEAFGDERLLRAPLPEVGVGSLVETEVTTVHRAPFFAAGEVHRQWLALTVPVHRVRVVLDTAEGLALAVGNHGVPEAGELTETAGGRRRRTFELRDVAPVTAIDPTLPPEVPLAPHVAFATGTSWAEVAHAYSEIVDASLAVAPPERDAVAAFLGTAVDGAVGSQWERIARLLTQLHREVRDTGLELTYGGVAPRPPHQTLSRRFGGSKDQAALLTALLRREGIPAYTALIRTGVGPDVEEALPGLGLFNRALVYVPGGAPLWIDPTDPTCRLGELPLLDQGRLALVASPNTRGLLRTPEAAAADNRIEEVRELYLGEPGGTRVVESSTLNGSPAQEIRASWTGAEEAEIRDHLEAYAAETYGSTELLGFRHTPLDDPARELVLELEARRAAGKDGPSQVVVTVPVAVLFRRLPEAFLKTEEAEPRRHDAMLLEPYRATWRYRIHIPPDLELRDLPEDALHRLGPASFERRFELAPDRRLLEATFVFDTGTRRYSPQQLASFRAGIQAMSAGGEGRLVLRFDPRPAAPPRDGGV